MKMEALKQTNYVKSIVTAQGKMDLERKSVQSYQGWMYAPAAGIFQWRSAISTTAATVFTAAN